MSQRHDPPQPPEQQGDPSQLPPRVPLGSSQASPPPPPVQHDQPPRQQGPAQWQQVSPQPQHGPNPPGRAPETNGLAIASLVCGVLGLSFIPFLASIAAVILAPKAKAQIDASGGREIGRGLAVAGQITGWIGIGLALAGLLVALVLFGVFVAV